MAHVADDSGPLLRDLIRRTALKVVTEGVIADHKEPALETPLNKGAGDAVALSPGIVGPMDGVGRTLLARQLRRPGARADEDLVLLARNVADGERHRGIRHVDDEVDAVLVVPFLRDRLADVGLVLMIAGHHLDRPACGFSAI